jgi:aminoglycoside phosphotransferase (APT) family kinase protein
VDVHVDVDVQLVRRLIAAQFPRWAGLAVEPVVPGGHDHRTFRLGGELSVRLPSAEGYAQQVAKEQRWLPELAPALPLEIPEPVAHGEPGEGYPFAWSVYRWLDGEPASAAAIADPVALAVELAAFLRDLGGVPAGGGPPPGPHNFHRGGPVRFYEDEALAALEALGPRVPRAACLAIWERAVASEFRGEAVWFHGDVSEGNLLLRDGRLAAVIDFGTSGVGDPACDVVVAWTLLRGDARAAFREALGADDGAWARGAGWALWKALISYEHPGSRATLAALLADPVTAPR